MAKRKNPAKSHKAGTYRHPEAESPMRPDIGTQPHFKKTKPAQTYRYDSSLSPALDWDGQNAAREQGEALIRQILEATSLEDAKAAAERLKALSRPFLNWTGKAERLSFDVPTLPLFIHERLSTKAIIETLTGHKRDKQPTLFDLFGDPQHSLADQALRAYEHADKWCNRLILGDSLAVMNSLLRYENLGGQVQMIYMDPPYGVKFGSNFQPFIRKRDVSHNDDDDLTREPEMVQAYRDTWEIGLHSYLTCLRDRLLLCRELLHPSGSVFVQISDENLHHVRDLMEEVLGAENFVSIVAFKKTGSLAAGKVAVVCDYLIWFARDIERMKYREVFVDRREIDGGMEAFRYVLLKDGSVTTFSQLGGKDRLPDGAKLCQSVSLTSQDPSETRTVPFRFQGRNFNPPANRHWSVSAEAMQNLVKMNRIFAVGDNLRFAYLLEDNPVTTINNVWADTGTGSFTEGQLYVVQTATKVIARCLLMTTDPGDLVLDPTCGSGTTAYVAEQWGRRWITIDTSRVPMTLARQRLLTATYPWYALTDEARGPAGGFVYQRKHNRKGEEVGGIVPHVTLKSIANNEPPAEEVLVDRPETDNSITRVTGPFTFEATIPTAIDLDHHSVGVGHHSNGDKEDSVTIGMVTHRMLEVLRKSPVLRLEGNKTITLKNVRPPAKTLSLSAEAIVDNGEAKPVALVFGPENGPVGEKLVQEALKEAYMKSYTHLYVIGFAIQPNARLLIDKAMDIFNVPATYLQATPDLLMGDLLKNMRSSQIFSVCGLPEIEIVGHHSNGDKKKKVTIGMVTHRNTRLRFSAWMCSTR